MTIYPESLIYVFALPDRDDVVKVGKTQESLARRLKDANSFHPFGVVFLAAWHIADHQQLREAESLLKRALPRYRSEWFAVDKQASVGAIADLLGRPPDFDSAAIEYLIGPLEPYDNLSGKSTNYKGTPLKLRIWLHQRLEGKRHKEVKLSRNPWRRPPNAQVNSTKYRNAGAGTYAPDPLVPLAVFEFDDPNDSSFRHNNVRVFEIYDNFCAESCFDVPAHLKVGWTPRTLNDVSSWLASLGMHKRSPYGAPLAGEHPKQ